MMHAHMHRPPSLIRFSQMFSFFLHCIRSLVYCPLRSCYFDSYAHIQREQIADVVLIFGVSGGSLRVPWWLSECVYFYQRASKWLYDCVRACHYDTSSFVIMLCYCVLNVFVLVRFGSLIRWFAKAQHSECVLSFFSISCVLDVSSVSNTKYVVTINKLNFFSSCGISKSNKTRTFVTATFHPFIWLG